MTSSSADCTLAGARLISSASRKLPKTGPSSVSNDPVSGRYTRVPTRSDGTRSGVNCTRRKDPPSTDASVLTVRVLARPGTPFEQDVAAREQRHQQALEHRVLADHDALELVHRLLEAQAGVGLGRDLVAVHLQGSFRRCAEQPGRGRVSSA